MKYLKAEYTEDPAYFYAKVGDHICRAPVRPEIKLYDRDTGTLAESWELTELLPDDLDRLYCCGKALVRWPKDLNPRFEVEDDGCVIFRTNDYGQASRFTRARLEDSNRVVMRRTYIDCQYIHTITNKLK